MRLRRLITAVCGALVLSLGLAACSGSQQRPKTRDLQSLETMGAAGLMRLAENFRRAGDREAALRFYREAAARSPGDPVPLLALATMLLEDGDLAAAETVLARARAIAPDDPAVRLAQARLALSADHPDAALKEVAALRAANALSADLFNIEAVALDLEGRHGEALGAFAEALVRAPDDAAILSNLALSMAAAGDIAAARDILDGLLDEPDRRPIALENLALVLALAGDLTAAEQAAASVLPEAALRSNRPFYRRLAALAPAERPRAVFLGILPSEPADGSAPAAAAGEHAASPEGKAAIAHAAPQARSPSGDGAEAAAAAESGDEAPLPAAASEETHSLRQETVPETAQAEAIPFYHLQIGSFSSYQRARLGWQRLAAASELLAAATPAVESVVLADGQQMHRLLIGPVRGFRAARAQCRALEEADVACVVIPQRPAAEPLAAGESGRDP